MTKFTFFNGGAFSNWHPTMFTVDDVPFNCAEQGIMYNKAILFDDINSANKILATNSPFEHKRLGRLVSNFNESVWMIHRHNIVKNILLAKFSQSVELKDLLLSTVGTTIVESSIKDRIWGNGLSHYDPLRYDPKNWKGLNLLGFLLTEVRDTLTNS